MPTQKKRIRAWPYRFPFTFWGAVALAFHACILILEWSYDQGGLAGALVLTSPVWGFMYWLPSELLFALNDGSAIAGLELLSVFLGLGFCLLADLVVRRWWRARPSEPPEKRPSASTGHSPGR
jgi:hypothetical protein